MIHNPRHTSGLTLPNLLIAGVKKAGTSSLFDYLSQHPDICPSSLKEIGFFSSLPDDSESLPPLRDYARYFAVCGSQRYRMEATPTYLYGGRRVISAINETLEDPVVVITLRDPVARLWSHWKMKTRSPSSALVSQTFEDYVDRSEVLERVGRQWDPENRGYAALSQGRYVDFLVEWLDAFDNRVRILFFEQWASEPQVMMRALCRWLEIDETVADSIGYAIRNRGVAYKNPAAARLAIRANRAANRLFQRNPRLKGSLRTVHDALNKGGTHEPSLMPSTRAHLENVYRESNQRLGAALKGRGYVELPSWVELPSELTAEADEESHP